MGFVSRIYIVDLPPSRSPGSIEQNAPYCSLTRKCLYRFMFSCYDAYNELCVNSKSVVVQGGVIYYKNGGRSAI